MYESTMGLPGHGIVLKRLMPRVHKVIVLDQQWGKIDLILSSDDQGRRLCHGALAAYAFEKRRNGLFLTAVDIKNVPFSWARHDILFLHHVLEIVSFFVPFESGASQVFEHVSNLYHLLPDDVGHEPLFKQKFLLHLFLLLDIYPEEPVDGKYHQGLQLNAPHQLDRFLARCIQLHPQVEAFKTLSFLKMD